jgi:hypothetical protein
MDTTPTTRRHLLTTRAPARQRRPRPLALALAALLIALILAACGEDDASGDSQDTGSTSGATSPDASDTSGATSPDGDDPSDTTAADTTTDGDTSPDTSGATPKVGCQPLASEYDCLFPYPSDFFLADDPNMPSGHRVALPPDALPRYRTGEQVNPLNAIPADGFSHHPPIIAFWPLRVDTSSLPGHADPAPSLLPSSSTLLINMDTGEPVLHFAELDMRDKDRDLRRALFIRPMRRLENGARYAVAIKGLRDTDGAPLPTPEGFATLRDGLAIDPSAVDADALLRLRADYEDNIFPALAAFGVSRAELQLAWAFTVQSQQSVTQDALALRADAMARMSATSPQVTVLDVQEGDAVPERMRSRIARRVTGTLRVPLYLDSDQPGASLVRGASGAVAYQGEAEVPFTALIPHTALARVEADGQPVRLLQFGHGFFGSQAEADDDGAVQRVAVALGAVLICVDQWGFSAPDLPLITENIISDPDNLYRFTDRVLQGYINQLAIGYAFPALADLPAFQAPEGGDPLITGASPLVFYGRSNGQIQGSVYVALSPHIERMVMNVGGASLTFMMSRAFPFSPLLSLFNVKLLDPLEIQKLIALSPTALDRVDPITYAPHLLTDTFEGSPPARALLMQVGIGDTSVPNLASHLHARALNIPLLQPSPRPLPGLATADPADATSGLIEVDYGLPAPLPGELSELPNDNNFVHGAPSNSDLLRQQAEQFLRPDGVIIHPCDGPCDPN